MEDYKQVNEGGVNNQSAGLDLNLAVLKCQGAEDRKNFSPHLFFHPIDVRKFVDLPTYILKIMLLNSQIIEYSPNTSFFKGLFRRIIE